MQKVTFPSEQKANKASCRYVLLIAAILLLISGCASRGARRIPADRFDYNAAIAQSTREQMLLNIVRSRYLEVLVFLTVSSVLTQYEYEISIQTRSVMAMMGFMARGVEVPLEHLKDG